MKSYEYHKPKIVITDIQMRDGDGIELVKKIRENDFETMIIISDSYPGQIIEKIREESNIYIK